VRLEVSRGMDQGRTAVARAGALELGAVLEGAPPLEINFSRGRPLARALRGELLLNGARTADPVQLIRGDRLELEGGSVRVAG